MAAKSVLLKWVGEFCAPVVVTVVTAEAEAISLKNGLLLHELLSSFGHLDGLNTTVRAGGSNVHISDAHIRFERVTELKPRTGELIEEMLNKSFEEFDMTRLPSSVPELKTNPPTGWNSTTEQLVMRSMAFSEYEMISHPLVILTVVASSDVDQIACMQELISTHHTPTLFSNGQYEPQVHRVFVLLHDASGDKKIEPNAILKKMQAKFSNVTISLLTINSFPVNQPNLQQPDMWSRFIIPKYFPQHAPSVEAAMASLPVNPVTKQPVLGCRLSMEDFMTLQSFCMNLFNQEIVPTIEKRLYFLHKQVNDARKGMKNLMKSFWRKPREDDGPKGSVKYRYDKVESQILLLADLSFAIKDFDTAISMYKLVRDDYKSDKSMLHLAHSSLMLAACYMMTEPNKSKDLHANLEALSQVLTTAVEVPHANAYFALLGSEMYVYHHVIRAPLEAAKFLLQASANLARYPLLSSLLTERAATFFLQAGQTRRYIFNTVYSGNRMMRCGPRAVNHAAVCFASAMLILDKGNWGDLKAKLTRSLSNYLKLSGREGAQRALLMMLKMLHALLNDTSDVGNRGSVNDALTVFNEIIDEGAWGSILIGEGWRNCQTRDIILGVLPISPMNILANDISKNHSLVVGFSVPALETASTMILNSANGSESCNDVGSKNAVNPAAIEEMLMHLEVELQWVAEQEAVLDNASVVGTSTKSKATTAGDSGPKSLADKLAEAESDMLRTKNNKMNSNEVVRVPLGEQISVRLKMTNKLPVDVKLTKVGLIIEPEQNFVAAETDLVLLPDELSRELVLTAQPQSVGQYTVDSAKWNLSEYFSVRQPLRREGALLQRTLQQRVRRERGEDRSMLFEVIQPHPLLKISFEGLSAEVLQGQLLKSSLVLRNVGAAAACDIHLKLSQPSFVLYSGGKLLPFIGQSSTVVRLDPSMMISPGEEVRFDAWLRVTKPGLQTISLLASYKALRADGSKDFFGPGQKCRSSYISIQTRGVPAVGVTMKLTPKVSSAKHHTLVAEMANFLRPPNTTAVENVRLSIGQLDLGNFHEFIDIEDCGVKVVGMQMLGAALPFAYKSAATALAPPPAAQLLAAPSERVVGCYPVKVVDDMNGANASLGSCSWLLPLQESIFTGGSGSISQTQLLEVMEQFMCIAFSADQFEKDVEEARRLIRIAEMEADESGPRTISQVRKDNVKLREGAGRAGGLATVNEEDTDSDGDDLTEVALDSTPGATTTTSVYGTELERAAVNNPSGIRDIAFNEAINQSVTVALLWICRWEGKIRWGMQNVSNLSFINQVIVTSSTVTSSKPKNAADYLLVGIAHSPQIEVPAECDGSGMPAHVVVTITLQCVHDSPVFVNLEAITSEIEASTVSAPATADNAKKTVAAAPVVPLLEKSGNTGIKWGGQTKFSSVCVPAHGTIELKLFALLYKPGVYDLKRFSISASFKKDTPAKSYSVKQISGQSLIKVVHADSVTSV